MKTINDGSLGINADSCAGCHRAHTASGPMLINAADEEALCLTCHGSGGVGSTVDVMQGVQYKVALAPGSAAQDADNPAVLLGALRNGGFDKARIDAGNGVRISYLRSTTDVSNRPFVGVGAPEDVTSSHLAMAENALTMPGIAWGNGAFNPVADAGLAVSDLSCASCHNPHGNGQFRILNPIPDLADPQTDLTANVVPDSPLVDTNPDPNVVAYAVKNYTIIQGQLPNYYPQASDIPGAYGPASGDYMRRTVPWYSPADRNPITSVVGGVFTTQFPHQLTAAVVGLGTGDVYIAGVTGIADGTYDVATAPTTTTFTLVGFAGNGTTGASSFASRIGGGTTNFDAPNGLSGTGSSATLANSFSVQMSAWCTSCHTRYLADGNTPIAGNPYSTDSGDAIYKYRHPTRFNRNCTQCHVTHGTNAAMTGTFSQNVAYPNGVIPGVTDANNDGNPDVVNGNSRLLKLDNRGTCQACHEPTETVKASTLKPDGATLPAFP